MRTRGVMRFRRFEQVAWGRVSTSGAVYERRCGLRRPVGHLVGGMDRAGLGKGRWIGRRNKSKDWDPVWWVWTE